MKFTTPVLLSFATLGLSAAIKPRQSALQPTTDTYVFTYTISQFIAARNAHTGPAGLDWTSDGCSDSPDNPFGFNFLNSCYRHDFGYRNFKKQNRFEANKARIDSNFKKDMYNQCATEKHKNACEITADLYYEAVKVFGKKSAVAIQEARRAEMGYKEIEETERGRVE